MTHGSTNVLRELEQLRPARRVVTIGNFDGVHRGHRHLIDRVIDSARPRDIKSLIVTFEPHPSAVLRPDTPFQRLTSAEEKLRLLSSSGVDEIVVIPFTREFAGQEPEEFLASLVRHAEPQYLFVGEGFRFGRDRSGDGSTIAAHAQRNGFTAAIIPRLQDDGTVISSSSIRAALATGDIAAANMRLGRRYRLRGFVEHGAARGRELGFPTANLQLDESVCLPADGIYAAFAHVVGGGDAPREAIVYVGTRPTFDDEDRVLEAYILDFRGDLYAHELEVEFVQFIRADAQFESAEALSAQMVLDEVETRRAFACNRRDDATG